MIEIEKKFLLTPTEEARLLDGAEFIKEKTITDSYYDTDTYSLTLADRWLRRRDGVFELKEPLATGSGSYAGTNMYHEFDTEQEIRDILELPSDTGDLAADLESSGHFVFLQPTSQRRSYQKDGFHFDIDTVTYADSDFTYAIAEIELLIDKESDAPAATERIMNYAKSYNLPTDVVVHGKVVAYLQHADPAHYEALRKANVLK